MTGPDQAPDGHRRSGSRWQRWGRRGLLRWMILVRRYAVAVVVLAAVLAGASLAVSLTRLTIDTSLNNMLSPDLPYRRNQTAMAVAFPQLERTLTLVVEAESAEAAETAAGRLADELRASDLIRDVDYPKGDPFFRRNGLLYLDLDQLQALADRLAEIQPLLSSLRADPSLGGLAAVLAPVLEDPSHEAAAALAPALEAMAESAEAAREGRLRPLSWRALAAGEEPDAGADEGAGPAAQALPHREFLIARPVLDFQALQPARAATDAVYRAAASLDDPLLGRPRVSVTGELAMRDDELRSLRDSMGRVSLISLVLVIALLVLGLRSLWLIVAMVATLLVGLLATAGFATVAIGQLNVISVAFAVLFIGLSVDFGIHFALRYQEGLEGRHGTANALCRAAVGVGGALALSAVAAAIGFFSFLPTTYRGLAELGLIAGVSMFIALVCNLTVLPALIALLPAPKPRQTETAGASGLPRALARRASDFLARRPRAVLLAALGLGLAAAATVPFARFDDDPLNLRDPRSESVAALLTLLDDPNIEPYAATVLAPDLDSLNRLVPALAALPEVAGVDSVLSAVPAAQDDKLAVIEDLSIFLTPLFLPAAERPAGEARSPVAAAHDLTAALTALSAATADEGLARASRRLAAALAALGEDPEQVALLQQALFAWLPTLVNQLGESLQAEPFGIDGLPTDVRSRWLSADGRARIEIRPAENLRDQQARHRFVRAVQSVAPNAGGPPVQMTEGGRAVIAAFRQAAATAVVAITLLLLVLLRRVAAVVLVLAPLLLAALLTVAATVVFALPFNFANVIVLPLLFGLGVAGGLHIELRARQAGPQRVLMTSTPRAVLFSALTTIGSFGALALSRHTGTASMGILLTIAISLTLVSTLVVLPALLHEAGRWKRNR
jgi:hopanoid biosynthesis associated RND transporter like protein HpnN